MTTKSDMCNHIKDILKNVFTAEDDYVLVEPSGYQNKIHVKVVSAVFNGMTEREKQSRLWDVIDDSPLNDEEKGAISLILPFTPSEL